MHFVSTTTTKIDISACCEQPEKLGTVGSCLEDICQTRHMVYGLQHRDNYISTDISKDITTTTAA